MPLVPHVPWIGHRAEERRAASQPVDPMPAFNVDDAELQSAPTTTTDGRPAMRSAKLIRSADDRVAMGLWDCQAGEFEVRFSCDEAVHILEGEVIVRTEGRLQTLRAGDAAFFQSGLVTTWRVPNYVRKLWVHHHPKRTIPKRIQNKVRWLLGLEAA